MKKLLFLLLLIPAYCISQDTPNTTLLWKIGTNDTLPNITTYRSLNILGKKSDTVRCIMLVSDTSSKQHTSFKQQQVDENEYLIHSFKSYNYVTEWQYGYVIRNPFYWSKYLDDKRKPLPETIIVWIAQTIPN